MTMTVAALDNVWTEDKTNATKIYPPPPQRPRSPTCREGHRRGSRKHVVAAVQTSMTVEDNVVPRIGGGVRRIAVYGCVAVKGENEDDDELEQGFEGGRTFALMGGGCEGNIIFAIIGKMMTAMIRKRREVQCPTSCCFC
jgi:hypothetical protein